MGADKNDIDIRPLLNCGLKLRQTVDLPSRQGKILDILLMDIPQCYNSPVIVPPVPCDNPNMGKPSDHSVPVSYPHTDRYSAVHLPGGTGQLRADHYQRQVQTSLVPG